MTDTSSLHPQAPDVSFVIPALNEAASLPDLIARLRAAVEDRFGFEIVVVDDGSRDGTPDVVLAERTQDERVRLVRNRFNAGQSAAIHNGTMHASGRVICTLDGDGQNPPEDVLRVCRPLLNDPPEKLGLVAGQRVGRQDTASKKLASRFANWVRSRLLKDQTRDTGCGLKAFRRDAFLALPFFNHMHRYLPALFRAAGWQVELVDVSHAARTAGQSNYSNWQRGLVGAVDLFGVLWLLKRRKRAEGDEVFAPGEVR
ncbi:glycosyltransferase family 2 protein [Aestuariibius sp. 2305UL40-4]|uniref:glycosyltransferase family 2 protein n=1 Tax=Aestuariibius violaceus TaxID=3234132 RepID=UPI00345ECEE8